MAAQEVALWGPFGGKSGPVHRERADVGSGLSWCGAKPQFRHHRFVGLQADVTCKKCLRQLALGQPLAAGAVR